MFEWWYWLTAVADGICHVVWFATKAQPIMSHRLTKPSVWHHIVEYYETSYHQYAHSPNTRVRSLLKINTEITAVCTSIKTVRGSHLCSSLVICVFDYSFCFNKYRLQEHKSSIQEIKIWKTNKNRIICYAVVADTLEIKCRESRNNLGQWVPLIGWEEITIMF